MKLAELISEIERRNGSGCRDLEWWIWWHAKANVTDSDVIPSEDYVRDSQRKGDTPAYTVSIDAASTLVPDGYDWMIQEGYAQVWPTPRIIDLWFQADAPTRALALTLASLKARAGKDYAVPPGGDPPSNVA